MALLHTCLDEYSYVLKAMTEKGKPLKHTIIHGVFVGAARSGKNSLMERLLGRAPSSVSPSTGVADNHVQVKIIQKSSTTAANVGHDYNWSLLDDTNEAIKLLTMSRFNDISESDSLNSTNSPLDLEEQHPSGSQIQCKLSESSEALDSEEKIDIPTDISTKSSDNEHFETNQQAIQNDPSITKKPRQTQEGSSLIDFLQQALESHAFVNIQKYFKKSWSLYLTNTGGQIEFQEVLPLLVSGPSVFFFTFRLDRDLNDYYRIEYMCSDRTEAEPYNSSLTTMEGIMQTLASISSMGTFVYEGLHIREGALRPKVFLVGTHKDQLNSKEASSCIKVIDQQLQDAIKSTSHYHELVEYASKTQMIFTVDNFSNSESDFKDIRSAVERVVDRELQMTSPAHWLIFSLALRNLKLKSPVISYDECFEIAQEFNISEKEELNEALHFIHSKMGLIRYFNFEDTKDVVIIDPQYLFNKVTELIVDTFTFERSHISNVEDFKRKGIFLQSELKHDRNESGMKASQFGKLLEELRIVAPLTINKKLYYFLPCALAHADEVKGGNESQISSPIPPLVILFQCGYCPKGLPGALISYLMTNEMKSCLTWKFSCDKIFRNQVSFFVGPLRDNVILKIAATYLTLICIPNYTDREKLSFDKLCSEILAAVNTGIKQVTLDMNYIDVQHSLTFLCGCKSDHPGQVEFIEGAPILFCTKSNPWKQTELPLGHRLWSLKMMTYSQSQPSDKGMVKICIVIFLHD